jgi:spore germination protein GerM
MYLLIIDIVDYNLFCDNTYSTMPHKPIWLTLILLVVVLIITLLVYNPDIRQSWNLDRGVSSSSIDIDEIVDFESCARVVGQVQESYPRRCIWLNETFVEDIDPSLQPLNNAIDSNRDQRTMEIVLYFSSESLLQTDCGATTPVTRSIPYSSAVARASLLELFKGPNPSEGESLIGSFRGMQEVFKGITLDSDGTLTIDFDQSVTDPDDPYYFGNYGSSCSSGSWQQIYQTMQEFSSVKYVVFSIQGDPSKWAGLVSQRGCPAKQNPDENEQSYIQATKQCRSI